MSVNFLLYTGCAEKPPIFKCGNILLTHNGLGNCKCHYVVYSLQSISNQLDVSLLALVSGEKEENKIFLL